MQMTLTFTLQSQQVTMDQWTHCIQQFSEWNNVLQLHMILCDPQKHREKDHFPSFSRSPSGPVRKLGVIPDPDLNSSTFYYHTNRIKDFVLKPDLERRSQHLSAAG